MDFLDPEKQRRHRLMLVCGYLLIACMVIGLTIILLYAAYGVGLGKNGNIIQNGLLDLSSQPNPDYITLDGKLLSNRTNASLTLPEGIYNVQLSRSGYRSWSRQIEVDGATIEDYNYPLLVPNTLVTNNVKSYSTEPALATQSPSRQWLVVQLPGSNTNFDLYNLAKPNLAPTQISLPANVVTTATSTQSWQLVSWSTDNQHVLLNHLFDGKNEYIMLDTANPSQSFNVTQDLNGLSYTSVALDNGHYNQYYLYNSTNLTLSSVSLGTPPLTATPILSGVISYNAYNGNTYLYATATDAPAGKVYINEYTGGKVYHIRTFKAGTTYLLNMASYSGAFYVVMGASSANQVYIYDNPVDQIQSTPDQPPIPTQILFVNNPTYLAFSTTAQFVLAEGGQQFAVYNLELGEGYNYQTNLPIDSPQTNATWMDGDRLVYISGGKLVMFEYDHNYQQQLMSASSAFLPFFTPAYNYVYSLTPTANSSYNLTRTSLYTPTDQPQKL